MARPTKHSRTQLLNSHDVLSKIHHSWSLLMDRVVIYMVNVYSSKKSSFLCAMDDVYVVSFFEGINKISPEKNVKKVVRQHNLRTPKHSKVCSSLRILKEIHTYVNQVTLHRSSLVFYFFVFYNSIFFCYFWTTPLLPSCVKTWATF